MSRWLGEAPPAVFGFYAAGAAFCTYFCMYAYRKPFAVGTYASDLEVFGISMNAKVAFIVSQILGYTLSKFLGIKIVSEMPASRRAMAIAVAIGVAEVALVLFAIAPQSLAVLCLFANGLALGVVWGFVFGFLEGRRLSDALGAGLAASFIVASGFVKTVGKWILDAGISEAWMPAATGAAFALPTACFIWLLAQVPPPSETDELLRVRREPMDRRRRWQFFVRLAPGLVLLTLAYVLLTAYRDFRDNFAREIWDALGYADAPEILTTAEIPVAIGALLAVGLVLLVNDNRKALTTIHALLFAGAVLIGGSTLLFSAQLLDPSVWMILVGLGLYMGYVPYNCVLFDRLIPAVGTVGTAGFMIYVTDSAGYLGSVGLLLYKNFGQPQLSWFAFFRGFSLVTAGLCAGLFVLSWIYFHYRIDKTSL